MSALTRRATAAVAAITILALGTSGCGTPAPSGPQAPVSSPRSAPASSPRSATPKPTPATPSPSAVPTASAARQLADFFAAAEGADAQLRHAAMLVNGGIGAQALNITPAMRAAVAAVDMGGVARQITAGMSSELLRRVLLVYSDLESRYRAFRRVSEYREPSIPITSFEGKDALTCLRNGAPAAARFGGDLASARSLALAQPLFAPAPTVSAATAEVAVRLAYINGINGGCEECGGTIVTTLTPFIWHVQPGPGVTHGIGIISFIAFDVNYQPGHGWVAYLHAC